ncbi:MAG: ABC transporter ATP-binding protein [Tenuifilum sp.]|uniref:ABC transporter ATP-binding protein n=2 Tax=Tenuifilum sp. TaxID=2760880 RepID=UPI001B74D37B|nr:ABC transporter ATP-binding protein [Bacteroidales bacterium]HOK61085.1 ABC transporter ATP-binding protein [Tenuifilum sp.]MBP9028989.1 ABC transporter ATP-binding protein [Bacteroidales bacterium]HON70534.1 ABC transporter ATP-binding protein [Tenuifilum sp.]HOU74119.1 ABC transporter ATP-binding protein [Tenuifilum sp.]
MPAIQVTNISKSYGKVKALTDVSLSVEEGEMFGLIGPDGAGKSTLIRIITTLLVPDSGNVTVFGLDTVSQYKLIRGEIGYMPAVFSLYSDLTVEENLNFFAGVFGTTVKENYELVKGVYHMLEPFRNRPAGKLSGGMKQKLALSCALIHRPRVLILDEPTTGVDAVSRKELWDLLHSIKKQGITVFVSTAYMDEAKQCDRVALIQKGRILGTNTPEGFAEMFPYKLFSIQANNAWSSLDAIRHLSTCETAYMFGDSIHFATNYNEESPESLHDRLMSVGVEANVAQIQASIEDYFIYQLSEKNLVK